MENQCGKPPPSPSLQGSLLYLSLACGVAALGGLLFGFDTAVISGAEGMLKQQFHLSSAMHGWIVSSALVGLPVRIGDCRHVERPFRPQEACCCCRPCCLRSAPSDRPCRDSRGTW